MAEVHFKVAAKKNKHKHNRDIIIIRQGNATFLLKSKIIWPIVTMYRSSN